MNEDVILYKEENGKIIKIEYHANDLVKAEQVNFEGWYCGIGLESIDIKSDGRIFRGTCKVGGCIGHIDDDFKIPNEYIICDKKMCTCVADLKSNRFKDINSLNKYKNVIDEKNKNLVEKF